MPKISELVAKLRENPEDMSIIPELESLAMEVENNDVETQATILKLQASNRELLKMIPVPEPPKQPEPETSVTTPEVPMMDQAVKLMHEIIKGG